MDHTRTHWCYTGRVPISQVLSVRELRVTLSGVIRALRAGGGPVLVGTYRKPEVVLMSVRDYEALAEGLDDGARRRARDVASATGSVLAELPGEFDDEDEADAAAYIHGDIDAHEFAERAVARSKLGAPASRR